jgi:hypothetical protein
LPEVHRSVAYPWQVEIEQKGYIEDRRPNANVDPYVVTRLITDTWGTALEKAGLTCRRPCLHSFGPGSSNRCPVQNLGAYRGRRLLNGIRRVAGRTDQIDPWSSDMNNGQIEWAE